MTRRSPVVLLAVASGLAAAAVAQPPGGGPGGPGGPGGMFGPPGGATKKLVEDYDKNGDGWLNAEERKPARDAAKKGNRRPGGFGPGGPGGGPVGGRGPETKPGPKVSPDDVKPAGDMPLYDADTLRTVFIDFENKDWESELEDFHNTDVEVPATVTLDGKKYPNVGVHFRGMSSYMGVRAGAKRSLNLSADLADDKQRILGYKTLNLLNAHDDPSLMSTVLYSQIAGKYIPTPKANFVKVVINGESWGVYASVQQFNKEFVKEHFGTTNGARWKVPGSPAGGGGLEYLGDKVEDYKKRYEIKSKDDAKSWHALIALCKTLNETPADQLEAKLSPLVDVDGLLWFLALDVALVNNDGYWVRASDYSIYSDEKGKFHFVPHDMNEAFRVSSGPGGRGPGGGGPGGPGGPGGGRPGGGGFPFPKPGDILPAPILDDLKLTEEQKKEFAALQKETDEKLAKLLTDAQRKQLKDIRDRGPMMFPLGGMGGGPGGGGVTLDPLVGLTDARKPLRSKVLAVPAWRAAYLKRVRTIAADSLDWKTLGPVVAGYRKLIEREVEADTRKLSTTEEFKRETADAADGRGLRSFADQRRKFLLDHPEVKKAGP